MNTSKKIIEKALLVRLSISIYNPKRQDKKITNEVLTQRQAGKDAGKWIKNLIDPKKLDKIINLSQKARLENYKFSLPWDNEGFRILPITTFTDYQSKIRELKKEFQTETENFINNFPAYVEEAKKALNGMFNASEYPSIKTLKDKFDFNIDFSPLPASDDFRINLKSDDLEEMRKNIDDRVTKALESANRDLWNRLKTPIEHLLNALKEDDKKFKNASFENIKEIVSIIPALNVTDDPNFKIVCNEIENTILNVTPDDVRENKALRKSTAQETENILKKMEGYLS